MIKLFRSDKGMVAGHVDPVAPIHGTNEVVTDIHVSIDDAIFIEWVINVFGSVLPVNKPTHMAQFISAIAVEYDDDVTNQILQRLRGIKFQCTLNA